MKTINNSTLFLFFILFIVILFSLPLLQFRGWFQWWNTQDPKKQYRCLSLINLAYFNNNTLLYEITDQFFTTENNRFTHKWWVYFITGFMYGAAVDLVPDGYVTPKSLCGSLIPDTIPQNLYNGKHEWPSQPEDWKKAITSWGKITFVNGKYSYDLKAWQNEPDNFLVQWGISPDAPIIIGFITNQSSYNGQKVYPSLMHPLLGFKSGLSAGGWYGFLQQGDDFGGMGISEANRAIWSDDIPAAITKSQNSGKCNTASITQGALGTGMGGAFAGFAMGGPVGAIIGALIGAGVGGSLSAASSGCI